MMQKNKPRAAFSFSGGTKSSKRSIPKLIGFVPALIMLVILFSCKPKTTLAQEQMAAISPTKMNVLYLGLDNPVDIVVSNTSPENIYVECSNGQIVGEKGKYIVNPRRAGNLVIDVYIINKKDTTLFTKKEFRVKTVPTPVAMVAGRRGGIISKDELLYAGKVQAVMENFDFDLSFEIIEFTIEAVIEGLEKSAVSQGDEFNNKQLDIIRKIKKGNSVYVQNIKAVGPDGAVREMGTIAFKIE